MTSLNCRFSQSAHHCEIEIKRGLLGNFSSQIASLGSKFAIISAAVVAPLYGNQIKQSLVTLGLKADLFTFPGGEKSKTRAMKEQLEGQLIEKGYGRDSCIIAVGGGVTTDLVGFIAATYCRGVPLVLVPTTLLGMVDASIGGKTGVNCSQGKNLIGSIYQSKKVMIDPLTLNTLPEKEIFQGLTEMVKHGIIADRNVFEHLENHLDQIVMLHEEHLEKAIYDSCHIKKTIVEQDERETGSRRLLNFGHTIGHALETVSDYTISHGDAVALGMLAESFISLRLGIMKKDVFNRIEAMVRRLRNRSEGNISYPIDTLIETMSLDKKSLDGKPRFVMIQDIGLPVPFDGQYCTSVDISLVREALEKAT